MGSAYADEMQSDTGVRYVAPDGGRGMKSAGGQGMKPRVGRG